MTDFVIDASSVLASIFAEPGHDMVLTYASDLANHLMICAVNLEEVLSKLHRCGFTVSEAIDAVSSLDLDVVPFDGDLACVSARLRLAGDKLGLSLGDRCCLALAKSRAVAVLTNDRVWLNLADAIGVDVIVTRPA